MVETVGLVIIIVVIAAFAVVGLPVLFHDRDTGANVLDQLFDVNSTNSTDNNIIVFQNGTWQSTNASQFINSFINFSSINNTIVFSNGSHTDISLSAANVLKNQTGFTSYFRGINQGIGMNVTQRSNDIQIALKNCLNGQFLVYNSTTLNYQCLSGTTFTTSYGIDNDETLYPFVATTKGGSDVILTLTNYDLRAIRERDTVNSLTAWAWSVPPNFNATSNIRFTLYWITQTAAAGDVCHTVESFGVTTGQSINGAFGNFTRVCSTNLGSNILRIDTFILTPSQHGLAPNDLALMNIERIPTYVGDTLGQNAYIVLGKIEWNI